MKINKIVVFSCITLFAYSQINADIVSVTRNDQTNQNVPATGSADSWVFTQSVDGSVNFNPSNGWAPTAAAQAGQVTSVTSLKSYNLIGNSTSANNWTDGNGIPTGMTLTFDAEFTMGLAGAGIIADDRLSHPGTGGNGLSISPVGTGTALSAVDKLLAFSGITVSNVSFTGTPDESLFLFSNGSVTDFGIRGFRSGFPARFTGAPASHGALLTLAGGGTYGFGNQTGTVLSNLEMPNNNGQDFGSANRILESFELGLTNGASGFAVKGVNFQFDIGYEINAIPEPSSMLVVGSFALIGLIRRRR